MYLLGLYLRAPRFLGPEAFVARDGRFAALARAQFMVMHTDG